jgi:hypothetical protein
MVMQSPAVGIDLSPRFLIQPEVYNFHVPVEQGEEPDDPLGGEAPQLVIPKLGDVRLRNAEPLRDRGLSEAILVDQFVQPDGELYAKHPLLRIGEPKILKHLNVHTGFVISSSRGMSILDTKNREREPLADEDQCFK